MAQSRVPLTVLDEAFLYLDETVRWSVQYEVRVEGHLDVERLRAAFTAAFAVHPMTRAGLADTTGWTDRRRYWDIAAEPAPVPLEERECAMPEQLTAVRAELYEQPPSLAAAPAVRAVLGRDPAGDLLLLSLHHAAFDGMSAVRLMDSVARAYAGEPDEVDAPPFEEARDLKELAGSESAGQQWQRARGVAEDVAQRRQSIARIHPVGGGEASLAFGVTPVLLDEKETADLVAAKPAGTTVNDLLLAALLLTVRRWNAEHGAESGERVTAMMPLNLRAAEWSREVCSNFASYVPIPLASEVPDELIAATRTVAEHTRGFKERRSAGWLVDLLEPGKVLPVAVKERLQRFLPLVQDAFLESTVLSNLGKLTPPDFGDVERGGAGRATEVWFSPPAHAPLNVAVGAATLDGRLFLTLRHLTEVFDGAGAVAFAERFRATVTGG